MTRVRRRLARGRLTPEPTEAQRRHWRWRRDSLRVRLEAAMLPEGHPARDKALSDAIRERRWAGSTWDSLRRSGLSIPEAQAAFGAMVPPWWVG